MSNSSPSTSVWSRSKGQWVEFALPLSQEQQEQQKQEEPLPKFTHLSNERKTSDVDLKIMVLSQMPMKIKKCLAYKKLLSLKVNMISIIL